MGHLEAEDRWEARRLGTGPSGADHLKAEGHSSIALVLVRVYPSGAATESTTPVGASESDRPDRIDHRIVHLFEASLLLWPACPGATVVVAGITTLISRALGAAAVYHPPVRGTDSHPCPLCLW